MKRTELNSLPLYLSEDTDRMHYLQLVHAIISDYFVLVAKPKWEMIFYRRLQSDCEKLHQIGRDYQITRERVRQIVAAASGQIIYLLKGKTLKKPHCRCSPEILEKIHTQVRKFERNLIIQRKELIEDAEVSLPEHEQHFICHIDLLMESMDYAKEEYAWAEIYTPKNSITEMTDLCSKIKEYLLDKILPVSMDDLTQRMQRSSSLVKIALGMIPSVEALSDDRYQISGEHLRTRIDLAYRILHQHGKPMHYKEIYKVAGYMQVYGGASRLSGDKRFKNIGKTGEWGLSEWNMNADTIVVLVRKTLRFLARPATYKELATVIQMARPEVTAVTMRSIISTYRKQFVWVDENTIALKEWKNVKGSSKPIRKRTGRYSTVAFSKLVAQVAPDQPMHGTPLTNMVLQLCPGEKFSHVNLRLYSCPVLERVPINGVIHFKLKPDYEKYLQPRVPISEQITNFVVKYLSDKKEARLKEVINAIRDAGYSFATAYTILRRSNRFEFTDLTRGKIIRLVEESLNGKNAS